MPISSSQMLEINTGSREKGFSAHWCPKLRCIIVFVALRSVKLVTTKTTHFKDSLRSYLLYLYVVKVCGFLLYLFFPQLIRM